MSDHGTVRAGADGRAVRFERTYAASAGELWAAWTEPDRIARRLGATSRDGAGGMREERFAALLPAYRERVAALG